jgi:membrane protein YqaA with SNARE-associated domain
MVELSRFEADQRLAELLLAVRGFDDSSVSPGPPESSLLPLCLAQTAAEISSTKENYE